MTPTRRTTLALIAAAATVRPTIAPAQQLTKMRALFGARTITEAYAPVAVAKAIGYYKAEGLDVELITTGGSNETAIQISAGNGDVGLSSPGEAIVGLSTGSLNLKYYFETYYKTIFPLNATEDSGITEISQLKGKKLGVQSMGSAAITFTNAYARAAGLTPDKDITYIPIGVGGQALTSIRQKAVDAIALPDNVVVSLQLAGLKLRELPLPESMAGLPDGGFLVRPDNIQKNRKNLIGFARAVAKAYDFTMANTAAACELTWKLYPEARPTNLSPEQAIKDGVTATLARMAIWDVAKNNGKHGLYHAEDWDKLVKMMLQEKLLTTAVPTEKIFTNELIDEINQYDRNAIIAEAKAFDIKTYDFAKYK